MIVVDTSVWIEFFRRAGSPVTEHLWLLLDEDRVAVPAPVRVELLAGASRDDAARLRRTLWVLEVYRPVAGTWDRLEEWAMAGARRGRRFAVADLLIAALATEHDAPVWALDGDFEEMRRLGWIALHRPR